MTLNDLTLRDVAEQVPISLSQLAMWLSRPLSEQTEQEVRQAGKKALLLRNWEERELNANEKIVWNRDE